MFELFNAPSTQQTSGRWQLVRLCLDRATQEWLNVGVLLRTSDGKRHVRLLKNTHGLACLYDEDAAQNAQFLL